MNLIIIKQTINQLNQATEIVQVDVPLCKSDPATIIIELKTETKH